MPIDPYAALNAMLRAEAARFTPPVRQSDPAGAAEPESEPQQVTSPDPADSAA
ncbi:hypothetical protein [Streptomyces sp. ISL-94]|uniref:hypothetical protein n=1 Tax=Streptomyces sp. ISL-94 TaxID=2819190 RepID=UPI001BE51D19|nr:hypothetical protein [Streptomyces sp. ISL-94]MBT2479637.1 hypothetical protein [Streptomyces sp. ISL-94]